MTDLAIAWTDGVADLVIDATGDLVLDDGLTTAITVSLGTDRLALATDDIPDGTDDRRGWWADAYSDEPIGSRLWLLSRAKNVSGINNRVIDFDIEALQWLVDAGFWRSFSVEVTTHQQTIEHVIKPILANGTAIDPISITTPRVLL